MVARRQVARLHVLERRAALRDQALRARPARPRRWSRSPSSATTRRRSIRTGKYLYFLSLRTFDPVYDAVQFELSFPRACAALSVALQAGGRRRSTRRSRACRPEGAAADAEAEGDGDRRRCASTSTASTRRVAAFPVPEDKFGQIAGVAGNKVIWTVLPIVGRARPRRAQGRAGRLELFDFDDAARPRRWPTRSSASRSPATTRRWSCATASACARSPPTASSDQPTPRRSPTRRRARAAGSTSTACARRSIRAPNGGRCCARCGGCSATTSGPPTCPASTGTRCTPVRAAARARGHARRAVRPHLGDAGRARHVARLRDGRRPPQAAGVAARPARRRSSSSPRTARATRSRASSQGDPWDAGRRFAAQRDRRRGEGRRAHRRDQRAAGRRAAPAAGAARAPGQHQGRAHARGRGRATARRGRHHAGRRGARALPRMGRAQPRLGARAVERTRRLLPPARHAVGGLRRVPSLLQRRVRPRRADRRPALQPRRPRVAAAAGEDRAQAQRLRAVALDEALAVSGRGGGRPGGGADQRARGLATATSSRTTSS